jgi:hypothetical protein
LLLALEPRRALTFRVIATGASLPRWEDDWARAASIERL